MRNTIVIVCVLALLVGTSYAKYDFLWTGGAGDGKYLTPGNWSPAGPPMVDPGDSKCQPSIGLDATVTIDGTGAVAGMGWHVPMYVGNATGDGNLLLVPGGEITGQFLLGNNGHAGSIVQTGGNWLSGGGMADFTIGNTAPGSYDLQGGNLGCAPNPADPKEEGLGYTLIGNGSTGVFTQAAGTHVQTRWDYRIVINNGGNDGTYTMNGGSVRTNTFWMGGSYSGGHNPASSATWNINSTDVDIVFGEGMYADSGRDPGFRLGHAYGDTGGPQMNISAVEGAPGETVLVKIIGGTFQNRYITPTGEDANVAGLNNITMAFEKNAPATELPSPAFEVAGKDMGDDYHGLCNNFAMEGLTVGGAAGGADSVMLAMADDYDNMADGADNDVLYVENLTVNADSWLLLNGKTIYYYNLVNNGTVLPGGGAIVPLTPIGGDANMDVSVGLADLIILANNYNTSGKTWGEGDFSGDGNVGLADLIILANNYGEDACTTPPVPEPATLTLLGMGALALIRRRRQ